MRYRVFGVAAALSLFGAGAVASPLGLSLGSKWSYHIEADRVIHAEGPRSVNVSGHEITARTEEVTATEAVLFAPRKPVYVVREKDVTTGEDGKKTTDVTLDYISPQPDAVLELGHRNDGADGHLVRYSPPDRAYLWPLKVGTSWDSEVHMDSLIVKVRNEVKDVGPLTVGKFKFPKAYRVDTKSTSITGGVMIAPGTLGKVTKGSIIQTYWVTPSEGEVKWTETDTLTMEAPVDTSPNQPVSFRIQEYDTPAATMTLTHSVTEHGELVDFTPGR